MAKKRKIRCLQCGFLDTIKRESEMGILVISARIARAILRIVGLIFQSKICLFGLRSGCEINKVFLKYRQLAVIAKEL